MVDRRLLGGIILGLVLAGTALATPPTAVVIGTPPQPDWLTLTPAQQTILEPLAKDWNAMEHIRRKTWLAIAERYPRMDPQEQGRVQQRMRDWVKLTPEQRAKARGKYRELRQLSEDKKQTIRQKWSAYKNLSPEEKQQFREKHKSSTLLAPPPAPPEPTASEVTPSAVTPPPSTPQ